MLGLLLGGHRCALWDKETSFVLIWNIDSKALDFKSSWPASLRSSLSDGALRVLLTQQNSAGAEESRWVGS